MRLPVYLGRHSEFIGNVATLLSGRAVAALIALGTMPIVSRLFTPSDFGVAALYVSIISILARVACLRYEAALVLPKEDIEAVALMALAYRLALAVTGILLLLVAVYELSDVTSSMFELLGPWTWFLPVGVLFMAAIQIQESWLTRTKSFSLASASLVVGNVTTSGSRIGFGLLFGSSSGGLIIGQLLGMSARLAVQWSASLIGIKTVFTRYQWCVLKDAGRRYSDFPKLNAPAALIFILGQNLPVLLFGIMFSPAVAGFYSMANQLVNSPVTMVAQSTRRVFLQKAASVKNEGRNLRRAFLLTTGVLALLGMPALAVLSIFGQPLALWFLGEQWAVAGRYLEIIAPWLFMLWVMAPCNPIFVVLREQRFWLSLQIGLTVVRLAVFGLAYWLAAGPEWTLQAFVLVTVLGNVITWLIALNLIERHGGVVRGGAP